MARVFDAHRRYTATAASTIMAILKKSGWRFGERINTNHMVEVLLTATL
jgi:hypothetical protein